ncbi:phospholipid-binding protein, PBP family [Calothrix sp. NIES-2098]|nr:phospholipid-binding protein, PBP family [Calothrix sp. NIES-2098]
MKLESSVFAANSSIPAKYTCDGSDISPSISWDEPPTGTESLALIVDDPDAPRGTFVHWVLYDIPATVRQLPEKVASTKTLPSGGVQGKNDFGKLGYGGPCPPSGTHRYFFKLYALDKNLGLQPGATKQQILQAMDGHVLVTAELIGRYQRQQK